MPDSNDPYSDRLRIRVNGLLVEEDALLLVQLHSPVSDSLVWTPPGGGMDLGESLRECLQREFREETGLEIEPGPLRYIHEMIALPYHTLEFYFDVTRTGGELQLGSDPEHADEEQLLQSLKFIPVAKLEKYPVVPSLLTERFPDEYHIPHPEVEYFLGDD